MSLWSIIDRAFGDIDHLVSETVDTDKESITSEIVRVYETGGNTYTDVSLSDHEDDLLKTLIDIDADYATGEIQRIVLPAGSYPADPATYGTLTWTHQAAIDGSGGRVGSQFDVQSTWAGPLISATSARRLSNFAVLGNQMGERGIKVTATRCALNEVYVKETGGAGLHITDTGVGVTSYGCRVNACNYNDVDSEAVLVDDGPNSSPNAGVHVGLYVGKSGGRGIRVLNVNSFTMIGGVVEIAAGAGIWLNAARNVRLYGVHFEGNNSTSTYEAAARRKSDIAAIGNSVYGATFSTYHLVGGNGNNQQFITIGKDASPAGGISVENCWFRDDTGSGNAILVDEAVDGSSGVDVRNNQSGTTTLLSASVPGVTLNGMGEEAAGAGVAPTAGSWPVGVLVENTSDDTVWINTAGGMVQLA